MSMKFQHQRIIFPLAIGVMLLIGIIFFSNAAHAAQPPVGMGTAGSFAILSGQSITNTGPSVIGGNMGVSPGLSVTGFPSGIMNGTLHAADAIALQAQQDLVTAYNDTAGRLPAIAAPANLGGLTVTSGVYKSASSMALTGTLTLDAQGDPNAVFIFQAGSSLTTASASSVSLINGAQGCNVFWQIGSSATLGSASTFVGNIFALTSISMNNAVTLRGRAHARNGSVTMINNTITPTICAGGTIGSTDEDGDGVVDNPTGGVPPAGTGGTPIDGISSGNGAALIAVLPKLAASSVATGICYSGQYKVRVSGTAIRKVTFRINGRRVAVRTKNPFMVKLGAFGGGIKTITARVVFKDQTKPVTLKLRVKTCEPAKVQTPQVPIRTPGFTG